MHPRSAATVRLCLVCLALLLLTRDVRSRNLVGAVVQKERHKQSHGGHGGATPEPPVEEGSDAGAKRGQLQRDPTRWEEIHTDYIYTQDVKHP
ncbi:phytosulfokines 1-like [Triticum urartu]|uniref:phytosulfokines 1-like n=1 Tax=Triticum urartu TaxID=4572 RepID=UPI00204367FB|nr:phytosulfokines 1-like [Triticum urartu]